MKIFPLSEPVLRKLLRLNGDFPHKLVAARITTTLDNDAPVLELLFDDGDPWGRELYVPKNPLFTDIEKEG